MWRQLLLDGMVEGLKITISGLHVKIVWNACHINTTTIFMMLKPDVQQS